MQNLKKVGRARRGMHAGMSRFIFLPAIPEPSSKPKARLEDRGSRSSSLPSLHELVTKESLKKVSLWFGSWREWQRRVFICRALEASSRSQLRVLATVLEPVLHIGFSSSLSPHLASLHADGAAAFQIQRGVLQKVIDSETALDPETSAARLPSLPATLASSETTTSVGERRPRESDDGGGDRTEKEFMGPALPLTHARHVLSPDSSLEDVLALRHTRFSSVPDFQSTTNLLREVKHKNLLRGRMPHKRSRSLGSYPLSQHKRHQKHQEAETFKNQLSTVSEVQIFHLVKLHIYVFPCLVYSVDVDVASKAKVSVTAGVGQTVQ